MWPSLLGLGRPGQDRGRRPGGQRRAAAAFQADQSDVAQAAGLIHSVVEHFGQLAILVNNAGVTVAGPIDSEVADEAAFDRQLVINYTSVVAAIRAAFPVLPEGGRIISISSGVATRAGAPGLTDYAGTKAALEGYSRGAARDLAQRGITVNVIQAGVVDTDMNPADGPGAARSSPPSPWAASAARRRSPPVSPSSPAPRRRT